MTAVHCGFASAPTVVVQRRLRSTAFQSGENVASPYSALIIQRQLPTAGAKARAGGLASSRSSVDRLQLARRPRSARRSSRCRRPCLARSAPRRWIEPWLPPPASACRRPSPRRGCAPRSSVSVVPGSRMPQLDDGAERHARLGALGPRRLQRRRRQRLHAWRCAPRRPRRSRDRARCRASAGRAAWPPRRSCRCRRTGSSTRSPGLVVASSMRLQQRLRLLRRVRLAAARRPSAAPVPSRSGTASRSASGCRRSAPSWPRS